MVKQSSVPVPAQSYENPYKLEVGSIVQFGKPIEYGVIKWIGKLPGKDNVLYAGVETVSYGFIMCSYLEFCVTCSKYIYIYVNLCTFVYTYNKPTYM